MSVHSRHGVRSLGLAAVVIGIGVLGFSVPSAFAQTTPAVRKTGHPQRDALLSMGRPITINFQDQRLEDVIDFIGEMSGARIEPMWIDDRHPDGLDKDELITLQVQDVPLLTLLERVLEQAQSDFSENTWQLTKTGEIQAGPKERLNKYKRVEIYDINDLLLILPNYDEVPDLDLQSVLQSNQGGGGQSPFRDDQQQDLDLPTKQERAEEVEDLVLALVEPEQWLDNGGNGGSLRYWQGTLIVNAPDYMHRAMNGYPYWPAAATTAHLVNGRRWVSLDVDTGISKIEGFAQQEVTAVVGGQLISSNPGGGG
jgi:hypothetical protein